MHPRLIELDLVGRQITISTYGTLVATGVMLGIYLGYRTARRVGLPTDDFLDLCFWGLIAALLGSRLLFVLTNWGRFRGHLSRVWALWEGGLVFYGGVIAASLTGLYFLWRRKLPFLKSGDVIAPVLSLGHAFGRFGCFSAGCCWGKTCAGPLAVRFPPDSVAFDNMVARNQINPVISHATPPLHPVQLYEAFGELAIFLTLIWVSKRKRFDGMVFFLYLCLYAVLRFITELYRGDPERRYLISVPVPGLARVLGTPPGDPLVLSTSQGISIVLLALAVGALVWLSRRARRLASPAETSAPASEDAEATASNDPTA